MSTRFADWKEARVYAQERANALRVDQAIRTTREYGKAGFNVASASRNDSDYARVEIVSPERER